ncbi:MAG: substrate-binding domain-containing protein [bacterium]
MTSDQYKCTDAPQSCRDHHIDIARHKVERSLPESPSKKNTTVFFDRVYENVDTSKVIIDDAKSARIAVLHLVQKGYKRIAYFGGPKGLGICIRREKGYREVSKESGLASSIDLIRYGGLHEKDGYKSMVHRLARVDYFR